MLTTIHCRYCGGGIEFEAEGASKNAEIQCPHCNKTVALFPKDAAAKREAEENAGFIKKVSMVTGWINRFLNFVLEFAAVIFSGGCIYAGINSLIDGSRLMDIESTSKESSAIRETVYEIMIWGGAGTALLGIAVIVLVGISKKIHAK